MSNSQWHSDQGIGERALRKSIERDESDRRIGAIVREWGLTADDCEAVRTIYSCSGNGASRIVDTMRELAKALKAMP